MDDTTVQGLLARIEALEAQLNQNQLLLRDIDGNVRVRLSENGLQVLDATGATRAEVSVDTHATRIEIFGTSGATIRFTTAGSEAVVFAGSNRMHWYTGLFDTQNLAVQRLTDADGMSRITSEIVGEHAHIVVRSVDDEWVKINTVKAHAGELLIKTGPHAAWRAPSLSHVMLASPASAGDADESPTA